MLPPLGAALLALALRAQAPRRVRPGAALALIGLGVHIAVGAAYGLLTLPFSRNISFAAVSAAAMLKAAALVIWASRVPIDDDDDEDDDGRGTNDPGPGDLPPTSELDWEALERELHKRVERPRELTPV